MEEFIPVSKLPSAGKLSSDDLFLVSREVSQGQYDSMKATYGQISSNLESDLGIWDALYDLHQVSSTIINSVSSKVDARDVETWIYPNGLTSSQGTYVPPDITNDPKILYGIR